MQTELQDCFDAQLEGITRNLAMLGHALRGEPVEFGDGGPADFMGAMDVFELIEEIQSSLGYISHAVMRAHIGALEEQLEAKLGAGS